MRIHQLPPAIANQIAAGEVIERPASVVKELLENALDAGASAISVEIGYGGLNQIKISDNGSGICAQDLPLAVAAHATSKIVSLDDLYAINTMGFRGEALASIASVARLSISSKPAEQEHAMMLKHQAVGYELLPCARTLGTTVEVLDLFYNAPVRKRFLKSEKLEFQAIEILMKRFALSAPHIALSLKHNNKLILSLPAAINEQERYKRMGKILGTAFSKEAIYMRAEVGTMQLYGWISSPSFQRSQNDRQWVYINQRMVKDKLINHALKQAYDGLLHAGRFPAYVLYLTIHSLEVDVNVHPTKHEVRFQQPRLVHDFLLSQLTQALDKSAPKERLPVETHLEVKEVQEERYYELSHSWQEASLTPASSLSASKHFMEARGSEASWIFLHHPYVLTFLKGQPYLLDVKLLMEHYVYAQLKAIPLPLEGRPLLVPACLTLSKSLPNSIQEIQESCKSLGLEIHYLGENRLQIASIPLILPYLDIALFLEALTELEGVQMGQLMELLSSSQSFDGRQLSREERQDLHQFLLGLWEQNLCLKGLYRSLSFEDCRMLLDE